VTSPAFSWLHLTDFHYGLKGQKSLWPNLRQPFLDDLPKLYERCGPWQAVLFTGDLAQNGKPEEFSEFQAEVLGRLWDTLKELDSGDAKLLAVPGNHDLLRPDPKAEANEDNPALDRLLEMDGFPRIAEKFWDNPDGQYRGVINEAFAAYQDWWNANPHPPKDMQTGLLPGDFACTLEPPGLRIGIVGLNTAFLQLQGGDYQGKLVWDARQLQAACGGAVDDWQNKHDFCLLLTHHGMDWLTPEAQQHGDSEIVPAGRFAVHLFGHQHETRLTSTRRGGSPNASRLFQGCSVFGMEKFGEPPTIQRSHGYAAGRIEIDAQGQASLRFWPRIATDKPDGWRFIPDNVNIHLLDDLGTVPESLSFRKSHRGGKAAEATPIENTPQPSPLQMPRKYWQQGLPESRLLWADEAVVPYETGATSFFAEMQAWLADAKWPQALRLVTGAGGTGKTRLSLELCQQQLKKGWCCGFWSSQDEANPAAFWQSLRQQKQPLLIVIDYAETRQSALLALVKAMMQNPNPQLVRLLLLARTGGEWWDNLPSKDRDCELFLSSYATSGPYSLPLLHDVEAEQRVAAYQRAITAYASAMGTSAPRMQPDLSGEHFAKPLYLQMAALLALLGEHPTTADDLTKTLLNHERRYWVKALADSQLPESDKLAQHLLGLVTLSGGFPTAKSAWPYWQTASDIPLDSLKFAVLFNALMPLYPGRQGLQPVQPDLLGEALVAQVLTQPAGQSLLEAVLPKPELQYACLTVLARLVAHRPSLADIVLEALRSHFVPCCKTLIKVAVETPGCLTQLACEAFAGLPSNIKSQAGGLLNPLLIEESVELAQFDYALSAFEAEKTAKKLTKLGKQARDSLRREHADNLNNLSIAMIRLGGYEMAACEQAKNAVAIYRSLSQPNNSDAFDHSFFIYLNTYANCLNDLDKSNDALSIAKQALEIVEQLARKNPDRFEPSYATSLSNYANHLSYSGKTDEALATAQQALAISGRLAAKNPDRFEPDYATSLNNYANRLSDSGKTDEALATAQQALAIRERLAAKNPNRYEADRFLSACNTLFLAWVAALLEAAPLLPEVPSCVAEHIKYKLEFYRAVDQGYLAIDKEQRGIAFSSAYSIWPRLTMAQQNNDPGNYFCVCAWLREYQTEVLGDENFESRWQAFKQKRNGHVPKWMLTVAERLQFTWPVI